MTGDETRRGVWRLALAPRDAAADNAAPPDSSGLANMDEISYWIYTKKAPCLMNFDNPIKKQDEETHKSVIEDLTSPKKKRKKKVLVPSILSIHDEVYAPVEKQQNVYFEVPQNHSRPVSSCKSETLGSDINFNIKNSSVRVKPKKNNQTTQHKKIKLVTSTPKATGVLRRSLRQAQLSINNNSLNCSFNNINNRNENNHIPVHRGTNKAKKSSAIHAGVDQPDDKKNVLNNKSKIGPLNGQFDDLSDVSGFTANYIRSTKVQSNKTPRKLRCKNSRALVKESRQSIPKECATNKSINNDVMGTSKGNNLDCSTDSSHNEINMKTESTDKYLKMNKTMAKFAKAKSKESYSNKDKQKNLVVSFQSKSTISRYPKRLKNSSEETTKNEDTEQNSHKRRKINKNSSDCNNSDIKENPEDKMLSRTRSGRNINQTLHQQNNSILTFSASPEQDSSIVSLNASRDLAKSREKEPRKKKRKSSRPFAQTKKSGKTTKRDSLRDKSGFTACFSDSDEDWEPLSGRKFFCA